MVLINPDEPKDVGGPNSTIKLKTPKRILHFSDGILEEYSDDEIDSKQTENTEQAVVDPSTMPWGPWVWYKTWRAGASTLSVIDSIGEFLAAFFGITTPKYYFELEEYKRREEAAKADKEERKGWSEGVNLNEVNTSQPQAQEV